MKKIIERLSLCAVCMLLVVQVSCDDADKLEAFLDGENPSRVTGLAAVETQTESIKLSWDPSTDNTEVTAYEVFQNEVSLGENNGTTTFEVLGLTPNTEYTFYVIAKDNMGNTSVASETLSVTTLDQDDTQAPTAPANLTSSNITETSLSLSWEASTDDNEVSSYELFQNGNSIGSSEGTSMEISELTSNTEYSFYVVAKDAAGNSSPSSNTLTVTTLQESDTQAPAAPANLAAADITTTSLLLSWDAATDNETVSSYEVFMNDVSIGTTAQITLGVSDLEAGTTYAFKVRAIDNSENVSEFSEILEVQTLSALPTQTIGEILAQRDDLSSLYNTISTMDFNLNDEEAGPFTVFAPNNTAFTTFGTLPSGLALNVLIAGHVAGGNHTAAELIALGSIQSGTGSDIIITEDGSNIIINGSVKVVVKDIIATNGVIHIVDKIITAN